jgi:hypothetical protein
VENIELAVSLVRSLFCGLPRQEKRMAVFVSASDETDGGHHRSKFWHGGWLMPETDWYRYFAPAWQERVLDEKPSIPYLHMTEIRNLEWCKDHGVSWLQAQDKMDTAAILISQMGSLCPIVVNANAGMFLDAHGKKKIMQELGEKNPSRFLIDHYCFNAYVFTALLYVEAKYPETEKVDFVVERKDGVSEKIERFYASFENSLKYVGQSKLIKYLGDLTVVSKCRVPVQAADMLCWHVSNADLGRLKGRDADRAATIFQGKQGPIVDLSDNLHFDLARAFAKKMKELEELNEKELRVRELRPQHARPDEGSTQRDKSRTGRGKGGKKQATKNKRAAT